MSSLEVFLDIARVSYLDNSKRKRKPPWLCSHQQLIYVYYHITDAKFSARTKLELCKGVHGLLAQIKQLY